MKINDIGYRFVHKNGFCINRPSGSGDFLLLFPSGGASFRIGEQQIPSALGTFMFYAKGTPQYYAVTGERFSNDWMHLELSPLEVDRLKALGLRFDTLTPCGDVTFFSQLIWDMSREWYSANPCKETTLELYFQLLTVKLSERIRMHDSMIVSPHYEAFSALRARIYGQPCDDWNVCIMARELMLSESYFQHLYKQFFGVSVISDVIRSRIQQAKYRLEGSNLPISCIAAECGYKNEVHFMRQFKATLGVTPGAYRKQVRNINQMEK